MPKFLLQIQRPAISTRGMPEKPNTIHIPVESPNYYQARLLGLIKVAEYGKDARLQSVTLVEV